MPDEPAARDASLQAQFPESHALCARARELCAAARATCAHILARNRDHPIRRLYTLARGASEDMLVSLQARCPQCGGTTITLTGYVLAAGGMVYAREQCKACNRPFLVARRLAGTPATARRRPRRAETLSRPEDDSAAPEALDTGV
jgi:hypothetical protein